MNRLRQAVLGKLRSALRRVVRSVNAGEVYVPPSLAGALRRGPPDTHRDPLAGLSKREARE